MSPAHRRFRDQDTATNMTRSNRGDSIDLDKGELGEDGETTIKAEWAAALRHEGFIMDS